MALLQTIAPSGEPVTLNEAKRHCRVDIDADDAYLSSLIAPARDLVERSTGRQLLPATWQHSRADWPANDIMHLLRAPLRAVSSITYYDSSNVLQTLAAADYEVDTASAPGRVRPVSGSSWPTVYDRLNAITITYTAGYDDAVHVPEALKLAIKFLIGHWYEHRENVVVGTITASVPVTAERLMWQNRVRAPFG